MLHQQAQSYRKEDQRRCGNVVELFDKAVSNATDKKVKADGGIISSVFEERLKVFQDMTVTLIEPEFAVTSNQIDISQRKNTITTRVSFGVSQSLHFLLR